MTRSTHRRPHRCSVAYLDADFLESDGGRPVRILAEYLEPLRRFREQNVQDTIVFFGSARVHSRDRAERALARLTADRARPRSKRLTAELRRSRKAVEWARYYEDARTLARLLTAWSLTLGSPRHRFVVCSGGGPGIMEAANRGAREAGGKTIGLGIRLPTEQGPNEFVSEELCFHFRYFFMRKFWFAYLTKALVIFPGGFGTLDEMFEFLTLAQTQKLSNHLQVVLYGSEYWDRILDLQPLVEWGAINPRDRDLIHRSDDPHEAFRHLRTYLTRYHLAPAEPQEAQAPGIVKTRA